MIKFYFHTTPNPMKVALMLEETGLPYDVVPVDTYKGEQHAPAFRAINPNAKLPAIDDDGTIVFDSNAIVLYLGEKTGKFMGQSKDHGALLSWLMFIATGLGPYSGQSVHFQLAHKDSAYATNRYLREAERHYKVLDERLGKSAYIAGPEYTVVDIAAWGWVTRANRVLGKDNALADYPNVKRLFEEIEARPATQRAKEVGKGIEFKTVQDDEAKRHLYPQNYQTA